MAIDIQTLGNDIITGVIAGGLWIVAHRTYVVKAVKAVAHEAIKLATSPDVTTPINEAVAATSEATRNAALKSAAHAALVTLGYDALALTYEHKSTVAAKMSALLNDKVSPETVEAVLGAIAEEVAASRQKAA